MAITETQRLERKRFLGSSDIAALFTDEEGKSLDPFKTAVDVWASKVFEFEGRDETAPMSRGRRYEAALIEFAERELGRFAVTNPDKLRFVCEEHPVFACNLDAYITFDDGRDPEIIEAKTTGLTHEWGEPGTDDVPLRVILQVHQQMLCTGWKRAHVAVLLGKWGLAEEMYVVERNEKIIEAIVRRGEQFWNDYVLTKTPPPETEPGDIQVFKRIRRVPAKYAEIDPALVTVWEEARKARLEAEKREKAALAELLKHLGDAEGARLDDGREFTYFRQKGADVIDRKKLKTQFPGIYEKVARENYYRVPRLSKAAETPAPATA